jgi:hypothetical protein
LLEKCCSASLRPRALLRGAPELTRRGASPPRLVFADCGRQQKARLGALGQAIECGAIEEWSAHPPDAAEAARLAALSDSLEHAICERRAAFASVLHSRLGANAPARVLSRDAVRLILGDL